MVFGYGVQKIKGLAGFVMTYGESNVVKHECAPFGMLWDEAATYVRATDNVMSAGVNHRNTCNHSRNTPDTCPDI
jgi:hypothetical protein